MSAGRLADLVLLGHVLFVAFVVVGMALILIGGARGWGWVRGRRFRLAHLAAIGVVVALAWLGVLCPLTTLESHLRERAGEAAYEGGFLAHWLDRILYIDAPAWAFTLAYSIFGAAVIASWWWVRPRPRGGSAGVRFDARR
jgi:multisubunit Na+/H+ antiporter MnhB subunit